jgi:hypothetical protein
MEAMDRQDMAPQERWSQIVQTAQQALVTEAQAYGGDGPNTELFFEFFAQKDRILRLLTDAEAVPMRMAIQQALADVPRQLPVPEAWTGLIAAYRRAHLARSGMDSAATRQMRDEATAEYARACDAMVTLMSFLANDGDLGLISDRLSRGVAA